MRDPSITSGESSRRSPSGGVYELPSWGEYESLRDSQRLLAALIKHLPGVVYRCLNDPDWTMVFVSDGCFDLTGHRASDLNGNRVVSFGDLVHPEDRDWLWEKCQESLDNRVPCRNEYRILTASGEVRWVWDQAHGNYDEHGQLLNIEGLILDITERKQAEASLRLALNELDHRVRNNLSAVLMLATQTAASVGTMEDFMIAFAGRIQAMARGHELASTSPRWIELSLLIEQTLAPYRSQRVRLEGPPTLLPSSVSAPLMMILHELATNSLKHGALRNGQGLIDVRWSTGADEVLQIHWQERQGPAVTGPVDGGLGLSLIRGIVETDLGGQVEHDLQPNGLTCRLDVPLKGKRPNC